MELGLLPSHRLDEQALATLLARSVFLLPPLTQKRRHTFPITTVTPFIPNERQPQTGQLVTPD